MYKTVWNNKERPKLLVYLLWKKIIIVCYLVGTIFADGYMSTYLLIKLVREVYICQQKTCTKVRDD
jgi:hypothetical protein